MNGSVTGLSVVEDCSGHFVIAVNCVGLSERKLFYRIGNHKKEKRERKIKRNLSIRGGR